MHPYQQHRFPERFKNPFNILKGANFFLGILLLLWGLISFLQVGPTPILFKLVFASFLAFVASSLEGHKNLYGLDILLALLLVIPVGWTKDEIRPSYLIEFTLGILILGGALWIRHERKKYEKGLIDDFEP